MLQAMKTGALLRFACEAGGILAVGDAPQRAGARTLGSAVGEAFQIADDLLDLEGDPALVGKQTGKDAAAGKATMVGVLGVAGAKARLRELAAPRRTGARRRSGRRGASRRRCEFCRQTDKLNVTVPADNVQHATPLGGAGLFPTPIDEVPK